MLYPNARGKKELDGICRVLHDGIEYLLIPVGFFPNIKIIL